MIRQQRHVDRAKIQQARTVEWPLYWALVESDWKVRLTIVTTLDYFREPLRVMRRTIANRVAAS